MCDRHKNMGLAGYQWHMPTLDIMPQIYFTRDLTKYIGMLFLFLMGLLIYVLHNYMLF